MSSARNPTKVFPNSNADDVLDASPNHVRLSALAASDLLRVSPNPRASIARTTVPLSIHC